MKFRTLIFLSSLFIFSKISFSQINASIEKQSGFVFLENKVELSSTDKSIIETTNFDEYRFYTIRKKIQLVRGPLIELSSIKELEAKGKVFPKETVEIAKSRSESFKHESILNLDIGLGVSSPNQPK